MLGCQDFCGYYDWTFHYVSRTQGGEAVRLMWAEAIAGESQAHYVEGGQREGLRGLYQVWNATGDDEHCDWTFTLDEKRNVLRWDMRRCPSKGFLLTNDLNSHEDYCDHCMGWIVPMLEQVGIEMAVHEHNHCGQCWGEMRVKSRSSEALEVECDIRRDPRWQRGYVERWESDTKLPLLDSVCESPDPCDVITRWFSKAKAGAVIMRGADYASAATATIRPSGVLLDHEPSHLLAVARRFHATAPLERPLLMHIYLPAMPAPSFVAFDLPRPVPILPWLIRCGRYHHQPGAPAPGLTDFLQRLADSLNQDLAVYRGHADA